MVQTSRSESSVTILYSVPLFITIYSIVSIQSIVITVVNCVYSSILCSMFSIYSVSTVCISRRRGWRKWQISVKDFWPRLTTLVFYAIIETSFRNGVRKDAETGFSLEVVMQYIHRINCEYFTKTG